MGRRGESGKEENRGYSQYSEDFLTQPGEAAASINAADQTLTAPGGAFVFHEEYLRRKISRKTAIQTKSRVSNDRDTIPLILSMRLNR